MSERRAPLEHAERALQPFQGRPQVRPVVGAEPSDSVHRRQQLERVAEVLAGGLRRAIPGLATAPIQRAPSLRTSATIHDAASLLSHAADGMSARQRPAVHATAPVKSRWIGPACPAAAASASVPFAAATTV